MAVIAQVAEVVARILNDLVCGVCHPIMKMRVGDGGVGNMQNPGDAGSIIGGNVGGNILKFHDGEELGWRNTARKDSACGDGGNRDRRGGDDGGDDRVAGG